MRFTLSIVLLAAILSVRCSKDETARCTCKSPWGDIVTREVHTTNDKEEMAAWREACRNDGNTFNTTSGTGTAATTTSTFVPCELD